MLLTLLGGLFGGLLRLAPEILKFMDAKNDRQHELDMQDKAYQFAQLTGKQKIEEINSQGSIDVQKSQFDAYTAAYQSQATMAIAGGKFVSFLNAIVRPWITLVVFCMWVAVKVALLVYSFSATQNAAETIMNSWSENDMAMLSSIVSFYFVGRTLDKGK